MYKSLLEKKDIPSSTSDVQFLFDVIINGEILDVTNPELALSTLNNSVRKTVPFLIALFSKWKTAENPVFTVGACESTL